MRKPLFGKKKLSQNRGKISQRLIYTPQNVKKHHVPRKILPPNHSDLAKRSRHEGENAPVQGEKT